MYNRPVFKPFTTTSFLPRVYVMSPCRQRPQRIFALLFPILLTYSMATSLAAVEPLSHLGLRSSLIAPYDLSRPFAEDEPALKGMNPQLEKQLLEALQQVPLTERILKVAVAEEGGAPVALIKVQVGDAQSRLFTLSSVEQDAAAALAAAFALPQQMRHVDFWAVLPELDHAGTEWHRTVFSVAAERRLYQQLTAAGQRTPRELLASLSAVRYDPVFTHYAVDWASAEGSMPRTAYTAPRLAEEWDGLLREGRSVVQDLPGPDSLVRTILGDVPNGGKVAITVDDGPHPLITPLFLDILRREKVKVTFFVVGDKAEEYPGLIREIARDGHDLGNHTYSHRRFSKLSTEEAYAELRACSRIVATLTGTVPSFLRPPGGDFNADVLQIADKLGLTTALWTHNAGDWTRLTPEAIVNRATYGIRSGDVILMHQGDMRSVAALPLIIQRLRSRGLTPAPLSEVCAAGAQRIPARLAVAQRARLNLTE